MAQRVPSSQLTRSRSTISNSPGGLKANSNSLRRMRKHKVSGTNLLLWSQSSRSTLSSTSARLSPPWLDLHVPRTEWTSLTFTAHFAPSLDANQKRRLVSTQEHLFVTVPSWLLRSRVAPIPRILQSSSLLDSSLSEPLSAA